MENINIEEQIKNISGVVINQQETFTKEELIDLMLRFANSMCYIQKFRCANEAHTIDVKFSNDVEVDRESITNTENVVEKYFS